MKDRTTIVLPEPLRDRFNQLKSSAKFQNNSFFLEYLMNLYATLSGFGGFRSLDGVRQLVRRSTASSFLFKHDSRARVIAGKLLLARAVAPEKSKNCNRIARIEIDKKVCLRFGRLAKREGFKKNADFLSFLLDMFSFLSELAEGRDPRYVLEDLQYLAQIFQASHISQPEKKVRGSFS